MELNSIDFFRIKEIVLNKVLKETKKLLSKIIFKGKYLGQTSFQCKSWNSMEINELLHI